MIDSIDLEYSDQNLIALNLNLNCSSSMFCILAPGGTLITLFVASLSFETSRILLEAQRVLFLRTGMYAMRLPTTVLTIIYLWITDYLALVYWTFTKVATWQLHNFMKKI
jgi:hypothetical protein